MNCAHSAIAFSTSSGPMPRSDNTTPPLFPPKTCPVSFFHWVRSPLETTTWASTMWAGCTVLGLGGKGNCSEVPVFGGENAEGGRRGSDFGPLRRIPTPGDWGAEMISVVAMSSGGVMIRSEKQTTNRQRRQTRDTSRKFKSCKANY